MSLIIVIIVTIWSRMQKIHRDINSLISHVSFVTFTFTFTFHVVPPIHFLINVAFRNSTFTFSRKKWALTIDIKI